jgi:signal transduction histidine kinase
MDQRGSISIRTRFDGGRVCVTISDTGNGIPPELLTRIFDPFFTTKPIGKGTGLGLSIAYGIINKHKGKIEVESTVGQGTTFRIYLPATDQGTAEAESGRKG